MDALRTHFRDAQADRVQIRNRITAAQKDFAWHDKVTIEAATKLLALQDEEGVTEAKLKKQEKKWEKASRLYDNVQREVNALWVEYSEAKMFEKLASAALEDAIERQQQLEMTTEASRAIEHR